MTAAANVAPAATGRTTVVIMSHNYGRYLGQAIDSVFAQTRPVARLVVVDDASTDDTDAVVRPYLDRIEFHRVEFRSQQRTRNFGLSRASSEYILFLDADDYMSSDMVERLENALDTHAGARLAYCDKTVFGNEEAMKRMNLAPQWRAGPFSLSALRFKNFVMATSLLRRSCIAAFDERIVRLTDWDTWLGMLTEESHAVYVPMPLLNYRVHGENVSILQRELVERLKILVKHDLIRIDRASREMRVGAGPSSKPRVVVLALGAALAAMAPWRELAQRHGWQVRAIVGVMTPKGTSSEGPGEVKRSGDVVLQTAPVENLEDLLRRYPGVITDPLVEAVVVTSAPANIPFGASRFPGGAQAIHCDCSVEEVLSARALGDLGTFSLSPAAARTLLYLPPGTRPTALGRLQRSAADLLSQHVTWRLRRLRSTDRRPGH